MKWDQIMRAEKKLHSPASVDDHEVLDTAFDFLCF